MRKRVEAGKSVASLAAAMLLLLASGPALCAQQTAPSPAAASPPAAKPSGGGQSARPPTAESNPFPEAESEAAQKQANAANGAASSGPAATAPAASGPAKDEPSSSSRSRFKGLDLLGTGEARTDDGTGNTIVDPKLGKQDVKVGQLYMAEGDYRGAYARFKEATEVSPGNADAVFYLAEAARKTSHLDEAAANYKLYLDVEPKGHRAKDARKALEQLAGK